MLWTSGNSGLLGLHPHSLFHSFFNFIHSPAPAKKRPFSPTHNRKGEHLFNCVDQPPKKFACLADTERRLVAPERQMRLTRPKLSREQSLDSQRTVVSSLEVPQMWTCACSLGVRLLELTLESTQLCFSRASFLSPPKNKHTLDCQVSSWLAPPPPQV